MPKKPKPQIVYKKRVSLYPLGFKDAVNALLKVKPKKKPAKKSAKQR